MYYLSINNQALPYCAPIPVRPLRIGTTISVKGKVTELPIKFAIDFLQGSSDSDTNIALHFNARFDTCQVVRNSRLKREGGWGLEELASTRKFPFKSDATFTVEFYVADWAFLISVDGHLMCTYEHRLHYSLITALSIHGDTILIDIVFRYSPVYPELDNISCKLSQGTAQDCHSNDMTLPYLASLEKELQDGQEVMVTGRVKKLPYRFHINLLEDCRWFPRPAVILHVNPRFDEESGFVVVANALCSGSWGPEERVKPSPFKPNYVFNVVIRKNKDSFSIICNQNHLFTFNNRVAASVRAISINGDLVLNSVMLR